MSGEEPTRELLSEPDEMTPYGSISNKPEPKTDEPSFELLSEDGPYTTTQIIEAIGLGKSQYLMMTILFFGFFSEVSETSLMPILSTRLYVEFELTSSLESAMGAASFAGFAVGYVLWGAIADKIGRRPALILSHCWVLFWAIMCAIAPTVGWLIAFRLIYSLAGGVYSLMIPFYYEYLAPEYRYIGFVSGNGFGAAVGRLFPVIMAIFILDEETENIWRYYLLACATPFLVFIPLAFLFLEESPRYLVNKGNTERALKTLQRMAKMNGKTLPENLKLIQETESGDSEKQTSFIQKIKIAISDPDITRGFLCILAIGIASKYIGYGLGFVRTELIFKDGDENSYCGGERNSNYYLQTSDYLKLIYIQLAECVPSFVLIPALKYNLSVRTSNLLAYGLAFFLLCFLYLCPTLEWALSLVTISRVAIEPGQVIMLVGLSALLPTKVRSTMFGLANFIMFLYLPAIPYLTQFLAKENQDYVTTVTLIFVALGVIGAFMTPKKLYSN